MFTIDDKVPAFGFPLGRQYRSVLSRLRSSPPFSLRSQASGRLAVLSLLARRTDMSPLQFVCLVSAWMGGAIAVLRLSLMLRSFW
jgi:hypothetical protein